MSWQARSRSARRSELGALVAALALLAGGCGSGDERTPAPAGGVQAPDRPEGVIDVSGTEPVGEMLAGSVAPLVQCRDWNAADEDQRLATLADVRSQHNLTDSSIEGPALSDEEASGYFDSACEPAWAQGLRLYKLYARAVGWVPLKRELESE